MAIFFIVYENFLWPHYSGPSGARGPGSLNRLNPRFLRHWMYVIIITIIKNVYYYGGAITKLYAADHLTVSSHAITN